MTRRGAGAPLHGADRGPCQPVELAQIELPPRQQRAYVPPADSKTFVPQRYVVE
jgi:hypothetical protein